MLRKGACFLWVPLPFYEAFTLQYSIMKQTQAQSLISVEQIYQAKMRLKGIAEQTP